MKKGFLFVKFLDSEFSVEFIYVNTYFCFYPYETTITFILVQ